MTVPATDSGSPTTYDGIWKDGEYIEGAIPGQNIDYHITPGEALIAVGSAIDQGGLRRLSVSASFRYTCCSSGNVCSVTQPVSVPKVDTQAGGVGSSVSNGIWLYNTVDLPRCSPGFTLRSYSFSWFTTGEDFHGNVTRGSSQRIVYP